MSTLQFGIVPTHLGFLDALVPDENGCLPRNSAGEMVVVAGTKQVLDASPVALNAIQISAFGTTQPDETDELLSTMRGLGLEPQLVMMVGEVNPMDPEDEEATVAQLLTNLEAAARNNVRQVNSTSIEAWMTDDAASSEEDFHRRVEQNIKVHARAYREANLADSSVENWNIEFLRPGEFANFTSLERLRPIVHGLNEEVGTTFFKALVDAAHCGDSGLSIPENEALVAALAADDELGPFHCSAKTTRGGFHTDDGWIGALLAAAVRTGKLNQVFVELFRHDDPALEPLRALDPNHGVDTTGGRSYCDLVVEGLVETRRRLDHLGL